uniref:(northern house mosquito) hypothetical protein n=1 Tax=Culex pipiens TaxID=7175 RepID=A0A8D8G6X6_CULPI
MDVSDVFDGPEAGLRAVSEQGRRDEVDAVRAKVGARVLCAVDPGGEHRVGRSDGADHEDLQHSGQPVGVDLCAVPGAGRGVHSVFGQDVQDGVPRDVCVPARAGDAGHHRGRERRGRG